MNKLQGRHGAIHPSKANRLEQVLDEFARLLEVVVSDGEGSTRNEKLLKQFWFGRTSLERLNELEKEAMENMGLDYEPYVDQDTGNDDMAVLAALGDAGVTNDKELSSSASVMEMFRNELEMLVLNLLRKEMRDRSEIEGNELEIDMNETICPGEFGITVLGKYKGTRCAVQIVSENARHQDQLIQARIWGRLVDHKNICKFIGTWWDSEVNLWRFVSESWALTLRAVMDDRGKVKRGFRKEEVESVTVGIARGLDFLHSNNLMHRNLEPRNIFMDTVTGKIKLSNFGFNGTSLRSKYRDPETVNHGRWTFKSDMYSLGVILWEMLHVSYPSVLEDANYHNPMGPEHIDESKICENTWYRRVMLMCWDSVVWQRISAKEVLQTILPLRRRSTNILKSIGSYLKPRGGSKPKEVLAPIGLLKEPCGASVLEPQEELLLEDFEVELDDVVAAMKMEINEETLKKLLMHAENSTSAQKLKIWDSGVINLFQNSQDVATNVDLLRIAMDIYRHFLDGIGAQFSLIHKTFGRKYAAPLAVYCLKNYTNELPIVLRSFKLMCVLGETPSVVADVFKIMTFDWIFNLWS